MRVAVIGGGPSGLVTLKYLRQAHHHFPIEPIETKLFESASQIGGIFFHHNYEDGELVSSKFLTSFSDFPPRRDDPDFVTTVRYLEYLNEYAAHFDLWPHIHLSTPVIAVRRGERSGHVVTYRLLDGAEVNWECDAIAVCSGLHNKPNIPYVEGIEHVPCSFHSEEFKGREQFGTDKTVMVLGCGETSFDIAALAMESPTKKVVLCHRGGWWGAPKQMPVSQFFPRILGVDMHQDPFAPGVMPIDVSHLSIFETMYVHPLVRDSMTIWNHYDMVSVKTAILSSGSPYGFAQYVGGKDDEVNHVSRLLFNKAWKRVYKYIVPPYRPSDAECSWGERFRRLVFDTPFEDAGRYIDVAPFPVRFDKDGVAHFADNGRPEYQRIKDQVIRPDIVVFATGYVQTFGFLDCAANEGRLPYPKAWDADVRDVWKRDDPTVGFIGFVRPGFGAIPPLSEMQAMLFITNLLGRIEKPLVPDDEWHYRIIAPPDARVRYGVEHDSYVYQLAKDMDAAPSFLEVLQLGVKAGNGAWWRLPAIWAWGPNFVTKMRMRGPWAWEGAVDVMTDDLWVIIARRKGLYGNIPMAVVPMIYLGLLQLFFLLYAWVFDGLALLGLASPVKVVNQPKRMIEALAKRHECKKGYNSVKA